MLILYRCVFQFALPHETDACNTVILQKPQLGSYLSDPLPVQTPVPVSQRIEDIEGGRDISPGEPAEEQGSLPEVHPEPKRVGHVSADYMLPQVVTLGLALDRDVQIPGRCILDLDGCLVYSEGMVCLLLVTGRTSISFPRVKTFNEEIWMTPVLMPMDDMAEDDGWSD